MAKKTDKKEEMSFEAAMERLSRITERLQSGSEDLDSSLELYAEGVKLFAFCRKKLDDAEKKIEIVSNMESGETEPFDEKE